MSRFVRYRGDAFGAYGAFGDAALDAALPLLAATLAKTVEIRTNYSPPIVLDVGETLAPGTSPAMEALQPTVILDGGSLGRQVIAPYGVADDSGGFKLAAGAAAIFFLGFFIGKRKGRRSLLR